MKTTYLGALACSVAAIFVPTPGLAQNYVMTTVAGGAAFTPTLGDSGPATSAFLNMPGSVAVDSSGNVYIADTSDHVIRKIGLTGLISTIAGTRGLAGYSGDGGAATSAQLGSPTGVAVDSSGNLYISDSVDNCIRKVVLSSGIISTVAGGGPATATSVGDGGPATLAALKLPQGVAADTAGNIYIADFGNYRVRKVASNGAISTVVGSGTYAASGTGDGGSALSAAVAPYGIAVDSKGNLFIADYPNGRIRMFTLSSGVISTVAGGGKGSAGTATAASLSNPQGVAVDSYGNIYIADTGNNIVRVVTPAGAIQTIAGTGQAGSTGDGGYALGGTLNNPVGIGVSGSGAIYVADNANSGTNFGSLSVGDYRVRMLTPVTTPLKPTITARGIVPVFGSTPIISSGSWISIFGTNFAPTTTTWTGNFPTSLGGVSVTIDSKAAYLWYVGPNQINVQASTDSKTGIVPVVVTTAGGSATSAVDLEEYAPSFSLLDSTHAAAIVLTPGSPGNSGAGYDIIGPTGAFSYPTRPAKTGETVLLFGVGFGPTTPAVPAGQAFSGSAPIIGIPYVVIGGASATVNYAGMVQAGLYQFNVVIPATGRGDQTLQALVGGSSTPTTVVLTLQ